MQIDKLAGIEKAPNLRVLYMSNNKIASWVEIDRLRELTQLQVRYYKPELNRQEICQFSLLSVSRVRCVCSSLLGLKS